jgi:hypothetical protein
MAKITPQVEFGATHSLSTRILSYPRRRVGYPRFPPKYRRVKRLLTIACFAALATCLIPRAVVAQSFFGGAPLDGIHCDTMEGVAQHIHSNLQLFDRGRTVAVPALIGIPNGLGCLYWVHTHTGDGFIHIESPVKRTFTLGQFFDIWGMNLSPTRAAGLQAPHGKRLSIWVNGKAWHGDPRAIGLRDHETIVIQNGPPFGKPLVPDWNRL